MLNFHQIRFVFALALFSQATVIFSKLLVLIYHNRSSKVQFFQSFQLIFNCLQYINNTQLLSTILTITKVSFSQCQKISLTEKNVSQHGHGRFTIGP